MLKGIIASFDQVEQVKDFDGNSVAYHPDRYIDSDEQYRARIYALFAMIDRDTDLTLTADEFAKFLRNKEVDVPANLEEEFVKYDTNGNGTIDNDELAGVVRGLGLDEIVPDADEAALYMVSNLTPAEPKLLVFEPLTLAADARPAEAQAARVSKEKAGKPGSVRAPCVDQAIRVSRPERRRRAERGRNRQIQRGLLDG